MKIETIEKYDKFVYIFTVISLVLFLKYLTADPNYQVDLTTVFISIGTCFSWVVRSSMSSDENFPFLMVIIFMVISAFLVSEYLLHPM